jgi:hypothetical protein
MNLMLARGIATVVTIQVRDFLEGILVLFDMSDKMVFKL